MCKLFYIKHYIRMLCDRISDSNSLIAKFINIACQVANHFTADIHDPEGGTASSTDISIPAPIIF